MCVCRQSEPVSFSYTACIPHLKVNNSLMTGDPPVRDPWHLLPMCARARGEHCLYRSLLNMSVLWWKDLGVAVSKSHQLNSAPLLSGWEGFEKIELSDHEMESELWNQPDVTPSGHPYPKRNGRRSRYGWPPGQFEEILLMCGANVMFWDVNRCFVVNESERIV